INIASNCYFSFTPTNPLYHVASHYPAFYLFKILSKTLLPLISNTHSPVILFSYNKSIRIVPAHALILSILSTLCFNNFFTTCVDSSFVHHCGDVGLRSSLRVVRGT